MKNFDKEGFLITLENKLSNLFVNNTLSVNELFDKFVAIFADVVIDFAPIRKTTRKEKKLKQKPWTTTNLLKCILTKNKMYNNLRVNRNSLDKVESYKRYQNVLNRSLRIAKSAYYHRVSRENKDDSKKVSKVINELVYSNKRNRLGPSYLTTAAGDTVTDTQEIAETFNEFFVNREIYHRFFLSG